MHHALMVEKAEDQPIGKVFKILDLRGVVRIVVKTLCSMCGAERLVRYHKNKVPTRCKSCNGKYIKLHRKQLTGKNHHRWKGGRRINRQGYVIVVIEEKNPFISMATKKGRVILEHRLIMAEKLNRPLISSEIVHHIDGDRKNNDSNNLILVDNEKHPRSYGQGYKEGKKDAFVEGYDHGYKRGWVHGHLGIKRQY